MKKFFLILGILLCIGMKTQASIVEFDFEPMSYKHFWENNGIYEQKILDVGSKIINANKLNNRITLRIVRNPKIINAYASYMDKSVSIYTGILPYFDNDDELAAAMSHEMAHCLDYYEGGIPRWLGAMRFNAKAYETKADLVGIDLMAKAGYNPIASITMGTKALDESFWDEFLFWAHPKGSKRTLDEYKYIYVKYPWALKTDMVNNINFQNFVNYSQKDINKFIQKEELKKLEQRERL